MAEQLYNLGKEEAREGNDEYAENSVHRDPIMQVLDTCGINYVEIYEKLHASKSLSDKMRDFVGGTSKVTEPLNNIYFDTIVAVIIL